ncbi:GT4 family glycosyltransferase PelF [Lentzea flava]|uniref:Lipopolysaccharide glycosyltransferase, putative n=1 Tax=Lentzea flava TaxID=103732 RepID=A0ABQ2UA53_9PSEU|nr:GT4 family glycosyltransferase PelF [Lentzea flava]MCP2196753.1 Glycosyltransferase involved in cell wall bisynthesis [Lentzea flava]GGU15762.1 lipopolysaccharide glycosyltransferase, putative [Lentzea flava]
MKIAMMTEGTYPHQFGGVSVWCDQLIRGMPEHDFHVVALVATGVERPSWELPANVASVVSVPLWGSGPAGRRPGRAGRRRFTPLLTELVDALMDDSAAAPARFGLVLRELFEYAQEESLSGAFATEEAFDEFARRWCERRPDEAPSPPSLHDVLTALQLLDHSLRALSHPPAPADVVHAVTNGLGVLPALAVKWRHGRPLIVTEHGIYLREQYLHARKGPYRWPVKALYLRFLHHLCALGYREAALITPGNVYNTRWERRLGARPESVKTVYNGVNPADFPAFDSEPEAPTISWVGRIDPIKDLETLIRAFALVHQVLPEARLRLFGSPPGGREGYLRQCEELAAELGVGTATTFEGRVENIRDAYEAGHVVVLSSLSEGFPYSVIEAMTCGRPCVATDVGGVTEAIADTGIVVPPRNPEALSDACLVLLRDAELRKRLGVEARSRALQFFTVDQAIETFDDLYVRVAAGLVPGFPDGDGR